MKGGKPSSNCDIIVKTIKNMRLNLLYIKLLFIYFLTSQLMLTLGCVALGVFFKHGSYKNMRLFLFSPLRWVTCITSCTSVVPHVQILNTAGLTTFLPVGYCYWHTWRYNSAPGGYEVTFQANPLMYLASLMPWCDTECKIYISIS